MKFNEFFSKATDLPGPYPYQARLAQGDWPDVLDVPTGLGKTAAVTLAWLYRRQMLHQQEIPRRLVWCLPMRVLVEQTHRSIEGWIDALNMRGDPGDGKVSAHILMGGEDSLRSAPWARYPEEDAILVGTQDMLLSRALMRGYGMSRYQWPVHFAWLHNDALWVFDEVQLMGPALSTSAQLEGLRRRMVSDDGARSLWASATLRKDWLGTIDFRDAVNRLSVARLSADDHQHPTVRQRVSAHKSLYLASSRLDQETAKQKAGGYVAALADEVAAAHQVGQQTIVIVNRVDRAQALYRELIKHLPETECLLLHARFRASERRQIEQTLRNGFGGNGRIIVATQAIEAGVDVSCRVMFSELAPWSSMIQRFGRCNRAGEHQEAEIRWIDITDEADEAIPYTVEALSAARQHLEALTTASPENLPAVTQAPPSGPILRRRDLMELFNTDPDLSGFHVDVSPYIRDPGTPQLQVFWRTFDGEPDDELAPSREELCPVGLGQIGDYLNKRYRNAWQWDPLSNRWRSVDKKRLIPGQQLLLRASDGGYLADQGFFAESKQTVVPLEGEKLSRHDSATDDQTSLTGEYLDLTTHLNDVAREAGNLADALSLTDDKDIIVQAGRWHDVGKAHEAFQRGIRGDDAPNETTIWAKSAEQGIPNYHLLDGEGKRQHRRGFRHELASMLAWLEHGEKTADHDLIGYLIVCHHGKVRLGLRALPNENQPKDDRLFARGVWQGDTLPAVRLNGKAIPETPLNLGLMRLGQGPQGPSWTERTQTLLDQHGPFRLAWLEALVRVADWRASENSELTEDE